jgi:uncharacterized membrane protein
MDHRIVFLIGLLHILSATAWVGQALTMVLLVNPVVRNALPAPQSLRFANVAGGLTFLTGLGYMYGKYGGFGVAGFQGRFLAMGAIITFALLLLLNFSVRPTIKRLAQAQADQHDIADGPSIPMRIQQFRLAFTTRLMLALQLAVLGLMVFVAHY